MPRKRCRRCNKQKALSKFYVDRSSRDGRVACCRDCLQEPVYRRHIRGLHLKRTYGLEIEVYEAMLEKQGRVCAICKEPFDNNVVQLREHVDHDHATGVFRGVLHMRCNAGLGSFKDSPVLLDAAAAYLRRESIAGSPR